MWWRIVGIMVLLTLSHLAAPLAVRAQTVRVPRIGVLAVEGRPAASPEHFQEEFRKALRERGYVEGQNVLVDYRWGAAGQTDRLNDLAVEFVRLQVDLIVASPTRPPTPRNVRRRRSPLSLTRAILWAPAWSRAWRAQAGTPRGSGAAGQKSGASTSNCSGSSCQR